MRGNYSHTARASIAKPKGNTRLAYPRGSVGEIMEEVMAMHEVGKGDTKEFAPSLRGRNLIETISHIHRFIRQEIRYQVDPIGVQVIKTPAVTNRDGFGDCKAFSLMAASILENLGIQYKYRFVGYGEEKKPSHVYIVALSGQKEYPLDACLGRPLTEKSYSIKIDNMPKIISLSGPGEFQTTPWDFDPQTTTEGQMELYIMRERLELEKQILEDQTGISGAKELYEGYVETLSQLNQAIDLVDAGNSVIAAISGFHKRIGRFIKKVGRAVKKVVTAPALLPVQLAVKLLLPKAAPFFLYLFIKDEATLKKVSPQVRQKRKKAENIIGFMTKWLGMRSTILMGIIRNGIMKTYKKTPEQIILAGMEGRLAGIGIPFLALIQPLTKIIQTIAKLFKKGGASPGVSKEDLPDPVGELLIENSLDIEQYNNSAKRQTTSFPVPDPSPPGELKTISPGGETKREMGNNTKTMWVVGGVAAIGLVGFLLSSK